MRRRTRATPSSAYGGIIATNRPVTRAMALAANETFSEVIVAPDFDADALEVLREKKNRRLLRLPADLAQHADPVEFRAVSGGVLVQTVDRIDAVVEGDKPGGDDSSRWRLVAGRPPTRRPWPTCSSPGARCVR